MKKSSFVALVLGVISSMLFGIGMCMAMLPEWNAFKPGCVTGVIGLIFAAITIHVWRKMENKAPIKINGKTILTVLFALAGVMALGIGMCFAMVWGNLILGIIIGLAGILAMLCLIPICIGIK